MALWTPANLATQPLFWFDAADASTITLDGGGGGGVLNWADKGSDALDAYQTTVAYQPTLVANALNGKPIVRFSGGNPNSYGKRLLFAQSRQFMNKTLIIVWSGSGTILGEGANSRVYFSTAPRLYSYALPWESSSSDVSATTNKAGLYGIGHISARSVLTFYVDGKFSLPNPARKAGYTETYSYNILGGSRIYDTLSGDIAEIMLLDADPSDDDRQRIEGYLAHKWGITANLVPGHPYFNTAPVTEIVVPVSIPNAPDGARYRIWNSTRNAEITNALVSGGAGISTTFIADDASVPHLENDDVVVDVTYPVSTTAFLPSRVLGKVTPSGVSGFISQADDEIYNTNGIDGSALTKFEPDFVQDDIQVAIASNFLGTELYAYYVHVLHSEDGIREWLGAVTAVDIANYRINVGIMPLLFDNQTETEVWQTDTVRVFRSDGARPVRHPTTGGGGIDMNWRSQVYTVNVGGSALTPTESSKLMSIPDSWANASAVLTAAQTAPIHADIRRVNDIVINGVGTKQSPWGPGA